MDKPKDEQTADKASKRKPETGVEALSLSEIGPRFVLVPIKIFEGSFGGPCLWENKGQLLPLSLSPTRAQFHEDFSNLFLFSFLRDTEFVPPFQVLKQQKAAAAAKYIGRKDQEQDRMNRQDELKSNKTVDELEKRVLFA